MEISRVIFTRISGNTEGYISSCDVVLNDSIMLRDVVLCKKTGEGGGYNLIFPSKQRIYQSLADYNKGLEVKFPPNTRKRTFSGGGKSFEEFFHPVSKEFYDTLLDVIVSGFNHCNSIDENFSKMSYKP